MAYENKGDLGQGDRRLHEAIRLDPKDATAYCDPWRYATE